MDEKLATMLVCLFMTIAFATVGTFGERVRVRNNARFMSTGYKLPVALSWVGLGGALVSACALFGTIMAATE